MTARRSNEAQPPCVVLDTNVLLSALVFAGGTTGQLRPAWQSCRFTPLASKETVQELIRVLSYPKFKLSTADQQELLADYLPWAKVVHVPQPPPAVPSCRDAGDLPFLHLAIAGQASALVTGDADLLVLAKTRLRPLLRCSIVTPAAFLQSLPS